MKRIIKLTNDEKQILVEKKKESIISKIKVSDELICNALISYFYQSNLITETELCMIRNSLNASGNTALSA